MLSASILIPVPEANNTIITCARCGIQISAGSNYCSNCGASLKPQPVILKICPRCYSRIPEKAKFCPECGQKQT